MNQIDRHRLTNFEAVLFDMDGVITETAVLRAAAWKRLFDEYVRKLPARTGSLYEPFDPARDYRLYVDGKSRYDGVKDLLKSRGLALPSGSPDDGPDRETICGLGNKKDEYFDERFRETGGGRGPRHGAVSSRGKGRRFENSRGVVQPSLP